MLNDFKTLEFKTYKIYTAIAFIAIVQTAVIKQQQIQKNSFFVYPIPVKNTVAITFAATEIMF